MSVTWKIKNHRQHLVGKYCTTWPELSVVAKSQITEAEILQRQRSYCYPAAGLSALASWLNSLNQLGDMPAEGYASIHETVT